MRDRDTSEPGPDRRRAPEPLDSMRTPTPTRSSSSVLRNDRGQAVVEFALVLPLLAAVVLVFVSFGKALYYYIDLTHVANEGARLAAVDPTSLPNGSASLKGYLCSQFGSGSELYTGSATVSAASVQISYPDASPPSGYTSRSIGEPVEVDVSTTYSWFPFMNLGSFTIRGSSTMRLEQNTSGNALLDPKTSSCS